jgi:hypothetical protein
MGLIFFLDKREHQRMLTALDMMSEDTRSTKKYIKDVGCIVVKNIGYFIFSQTMNDITCC